MKYSRFRGLGHKTVDEFIREPVAVAGTTNLHGDGIDPKSIEAVMKQKNYRQEKYLELVKKWIEDCCEYSYLSCVTQAEMIESYSKFLQKNIDLNKTLVTFSLNCQDIPKLDHRFYYKRAYICKTCKTRHFKACCGNYHINNRTNIHFMINMKIRPITTEEVSPIDGAIGSVVEPI